MIIAKINGVATVLKRLQIGSKWGAIKKIRYAPIKVKTMLPTPIKVRNEKSTFMVGPPQKASPSSKRKAGYSAKQYPTVFDSGMLGFQIQHFFEGGYIFTRLRNLCSMCIIPCLTSSTRPTAM